MHFVFAAWPEIQAWRLVNQYARFTNPTGCCCSSADKGKQARGLQSEGARAPGHDVNANWKQKRARALHFYKPRSAVINPTPVPNLALLDVILNTVSMGQESAQTVGRKDSCDDRRRGGVWVDGLAGGAAMHGQADDSRWCLDAGVRLA